MKLLISNINVGLDYTDDELRAQAAKKLNVKPGSLNNIKIVKQSIDARKKPGIRFVYTISVDIDAKKIREDKDVRILLEEKPEVLAPGDIRISTRPVVVGAGPAGLFCALLLAQNGYKPRLIERGQCVEQRTATIHGFWQGSALNPDSNVQFGEGGAGTFSDGKLTTRINDARCEKILREFHKFGAPDEIMYKAKPHIGTDILKDVIINMRKEIERLGGEVLFDTRMDNIIIKDGKVVGIEVNSEYRDLSSKILRGHEPLSGNSCGKSNDSSRFSSNSSGAIGNGSSIIDCEVLVLALGHSARDTFSMLYQKGITFVQKPFSIGVRIEHPQGMIDESQLGTAAGHPRLGAADYQLFDKRGDRTTYSFCMCPGGIVVASASEPDTIVTNGMSEYARDRENANSALVVSISTDDFPDSHPLSGIEFQRIWEKKAFMVAGASGAAPVQTVGDFILGKKGKIGSVKPSYTGRVECSDINQCLPSFVTDNMKQSLSVFDRKIKGFAMSDALLTGVETRTSSPVRIPRNEQLQCVGYEGIYPAGEGAGYAGGIVSAGVDGLRIAEQIIKTYRPQF